MTSVQDLVNYLQRSSHHGKRVAHVAKIESRSTVGGTLTRDLPNSLRNYLEKRDISLYSHQCQAIEGIRRKENIIITTPTASGKTFAFNLPIFEELLQDQKGTALYLYPTKALSNDQLKVIHSFERETGLDLEAAIYDGDTPRNRRPQIRARSRLIVSNPYELHQVLPWHFKWKGFYQNLKFVVLDEAHGYRGVFGSHIAFLIRRLRRICQQYGSSPQFIISSATLANPLEFARKLTGLDFTLISDDGSVRGTKYFILYNPYFDGVGETTVHQETMKLFKLLIWRKNQTLCFTYSRKMAELLVTWVKSDLAETTPRLVDKIAAYRAGYLAEERRLIEHKLKTGALRGVITTNALELGIDIGSLDAVIISGYPGTIISTWQQAGRAGRGIAESLAILVAFQNPLDQYFMNHPQVFFDKPHEHAIIDTSNPYIRAGHLLCACAEMPLTEKQEETFFGEDREKILESLDQEGLLRHTTRGWVYASTARPVEVVKLNNISSELFKIIYNNRLLETMDKLQAFREAHPGAVLLHQGETYVVQELDLDQRTAHVIKRKVNYHTIPLKLETVRVLEEFEHQSINGVDFFYGDLEITQKYVNYKIMERDMVRGYEDLNLPDLEFRTTGLWFLIPREIEEQIWRNNLDFGGGLHGLEHALIGIMPFHVMCDRWDIGGLSTPFHDDTAAPSIFIYDGYEGGIGLTEKAYTLIKEIMSMGYELVRDCKCEEGCPACVYSPKCGNENKPMDKEATILIAEGILERLKMAK